MLPDHENLASLFTQLDRNTEIAHNSLTISAIWKYPKNQLSAPVWIGLFILMLFYLSALTILPTFLFIEGLAKQLSSC